MHHTRYILGNGTLFIRGHLDISSLLFNEDEREIFWIFYLKFLLLNLDKKIGEHGTKKNKCIVSILGKLVGTMMLFYRKKIKVLSCLDACYARLIQGSVRSLNYH